MAFRKRNVAVGRSTQSPISETSDVTAPATEAVPPGTRPSPIDGRLTTSTGTASLDSITGHGGIPIGHSLLVEETGTTDYGGVLLKYFAAEGFAQGQKVLVVGVGEQWGRELPGIVTVEADNGRNIVSKPKDSDKMKIAWRYESLGEFGTSRRGVLIHSLDNKSSDICAIYSYGADILIQHLSGPLRQLPRQQRTSLHHSATPLT